MLVCNISILKFVNCNARYKNHLFRAWENAIDVANLAALQI
jgi:hypothetical protein